jgi:hypothetical protein
VTAGRQRRESWQPGYSFRSGDFREQPARETDDDSRPCSRGQRCAAATTARQPDGSYVREPAGSPRTFCERDRGLILERLGELPKAWQDLDNGAAVLRRSGSALHMPYGPSVPLDVGMDALRREMAVILAGWHARVATIANLAGAGNAAADPGETVAAAARVLAPRIDALLGLEPAWMFRNLPAGQRPHPEIPRDPLARPRWRRPAPDYLPSGDPRDVLPARGLAAVPAAVADEYGDDEIVRAGPGYLTVLTLAGGAAAGLDVLSLHARCERLLGQVADRPDILDGVPCRRTGCEDFALERAEPPSDPDQPAMYSRCASCGDMMSLADYREWSAWYARWAEGAVADCVRCQNGDHKACLWGACQCRAGGHSAA